MQLVKKFPKQQIKYCLRATQGLYILLQTRMCLLLHAWPDLTWFNLDCTQKLIHESHCPLRLELNANDS